MTKSDGPGEALSRMMEEWDALKTSDDARQTIVGDMFEMLHDMRKKNEALQTEIETLKYHEVHFHTDRKRLEAENSALNQQAETGPFVFVVIDGDNTLFNDSFIQAGIEGGFKAAQRLQEALKMYLDNVLGVQQHRKIMVRIYVQMKGLVETYNRARIGPGMDGFRSFVLGFNRELPLAEFVDAGDDKEAADNKIKANLELYWKNIHCKHLILAASADRGYVSFLRQYSTESAGAEKLTLIEAVEFPPAFQGLAHRFKVTRFDGIFRSRKIVVANGLAPRIEAAEGSYATAAAYASAAPPSPILRRLTPPTQTSAAPVKRSIQVNDAGQRIDKPLPQYDNALVKMLQGRNLCNRHYLSRCPKDSQYCPFDHKAKLSDEEERALMRVARLAPCNVGSRCRDPDCVSGHHCPYGENCYFMSTCRYTLAMHNIDKTVIKTI